MNCNITSFSETCISRRLYTSLAVGKVGFKIVLYRQRNTKALINLSPSCTHINIAGFLMSRPIIEPRHEKTCCCFFHILKQRHNSVAR